MEEVDMSCMESADRAFCCSHSPDKVDDKWDVLAPAVEVGAAMSLCLLTRLRQTLLFL